jgi:hypothetical protein
MCIALFFNKIYLYFLIIILKDSIMKYDSRSRSSITISDIEITRIQFNASIFNF